MHSSAKKNHMIHQVNNKRNQTVIGVGHLTFEGGGRVWVICTGHIFCNPFMH